MLECAKMSCHNPVLKTDWYRFAKFCEAHSYGRRANKKRVKEY
jgi:hypothetical protein